MKKQKYTLIELLVTIAIILILAGIAIPSTGYAIKRARMTQARADIAALVTALKSYESTYRLLPISVSLSHKKVGEGSNANDYDTLLQILSQVNLNGKNEKVKGNLRKVKFLDVNQKFPEKGFVDPWGKRYIILVNSNHSDTDITLGGKNLIGTVFVYSCGPNGIDDDGANPTNNKDKHKDDICSWDIL